MRNDDTWLEDSAGSRKRGLDNSDWMQSEDNESEADEDINGGSVN